MNCWIFFRMFPKCQLIQISSKFNSFLNQFKILKTCVGKIAPYGTFRRYSLLRILILKIYLTCGCYGNGCHDNQDDETSVLIGSLVQRTGRPTHT